MTHTLMLSGVCQSLSRYKNDIAVNSEISPYDYTLMTSGVCQSLSGYENDIAANSEISLYDPYFNAKWCVSVFKWL